MSRDREEGVILVNVLVALALGAALVTLMLTSQDAAIDRARRAGAATQAEALALGAETSVLLALERDLREAPEADSLAEPWAQAAQQEVELETGRFAVTIRDAQARLDLNALPQAGLAGVQLLARLVAELELPEAVASRILEAVARGPLLDLSDVEGLDAQARAALAPHVTALPWPASVNLNTADPLLMGILLGNRPAARRLAAQRDREGSIDDDDLEALGLLPTAAVGFTSDVWDVEIMAEVDDVAVRLMSRLVRRRGPGVAAVVVTARRLLGEGPAASDTLPPVPAFSDGPP